MIGPLILPGLDAVDVEAELIIGTFEMDDMALGDVIYAERLPIYDVVMPLGYTDAGHLRLVGKRHRYPFLERLPDVGFRPRDGVVEIELPFAIEAYVAPLNQLRARRLG